MILEGNSVLLANPLAFFARPHTGLGLALLLSKHPPSFVLHIRSGNVLCEKVWFDECCFSRRESFVSRASRSNDN